MFRLHFVSLNMTKRVGRGHRERKERKMEREELKKRAKTIAKAVEGMKRYEWLKIAHAIEKKYSSAAARVEAGSAEEIEKSISMEI